MSNIIGVGIDATDIMRLASVLERYGDRFLHRVFTRGEIEYCTARHEPAIHFAARFAAKEAAMKALGTGHSRGVFWQSVEVVRTGGPPRLVFHEGASKRFTMIGGVSSFLTITHSETLAIAHVILVGA